MPKLYHSWNIIDIFCFYSPLPPFASPPVSPPSLPSLLPLDPCKYIPSSPPPKTFFPRVEHLRVFYGGVRGYRSCLRGHRLLEEEEWLVLKRLLRPTLDYLPCHILSPRSCDFRFDGGERHSGKRRMIGLTARSMCCAARRACGAVVNRSWTSQTSAAFCSNCSEDNGILGEF